MSVSKGQRNEIIKQAGLYSAGTQLTQLITLAAAILSRRFLGPAQTGVWAALQVIVDYSKYASLGIMDAASREIPTALGRGDLAEADKIKNITFTFVTVSSFAVAAAILAAAFLFGPRLRPELMYGLYFVAGVVFLQRLNNLFVATLRSYKQFRVEAVFMVLSAIVNAGLVAVLTYHFKIYGFIWALIFSFVFNIAYLSLSYPYRFHWLADWKKMKPLMDYGLPLMIIGIVVTVLKSVDKILIAKVLGFESLGYYSIALMACSYLGNFSISIAIVLLPYSQEKFGQRRNAQDLSRFILKSSKAYALTLPLLIGMAWFFVPLAVWLVLPKFTQGILAMKILTLNLFFTAQLQPFHDYLITIKKHNWLLPLLGALCALAVMLNMFVIHMGWGIEGVAIATVSVSFIYFAVVLWMSAKFFSEGTPVFKHFGKVCAVFCFFTVVLFVLQGDSLRQPSHDILFYIGRILLFLVAYLPLGWLLNREFSLTQMLFSKLNQWARKASGL